MSFRIAQVSDTHLSPAKPYFAPGFLKVAAHINASNPDLVVNSGDMALDGAAVEADLIEARRLHEAIEVPVRFIPGNHDLGEGMDMPVPAGHPVVSEERRARYLGHFGPDFWQFDVPGWRIVAINSQLLGSTLAATGEQLRFVSEAVAGAGRSSIALFVHKPLFHLLPDEEVIGGRFVNPAARRELLAAFGKATPRLVASGHVHQFYEASHPGSRHVWAPTTAFVLPDERQPRYGTKEVGYVEHVLESDGSHSSRFVDVPGLVTLSIADYMDAYAHYERPHVAGDTPPA